MREIKFRAWNKEAKQMIPVWHLDFDSDTGRVDFVKSIYPNEINAIEEVELMQYTGLHDKNGKEIYEGDIVRHEYKAGHSIYQVCFGEYEYEVDDEHESEQGVGWYLKCILKIYEGNEMLTFRVRELPINGYPYYSDTEIIGNIYENPELLQKEAA